MFADAHGCIKSVVVAVETATLSWTGPAIIKVGAVRQRSQFEVAGPSLSSSWLIYHFMEH